MVNILTIFYSLFSDNFGLSIIVFTILIRILMIPLSFRQVKQMIGMQSIQPKLKQIQAKYKKIIYTQCNLYFRWISINFG